MYKITKKELEAKIKDKNIMVKEFQENIINYEDYQEGYTDTIYQFIIDNSIFYVASQYEQEGLDLIIDHLEDEGLKGYFLEVETYEDDYIIDINDNKYYCDEYVIGGNHGLILYHGGNFRIEELSI